MSSDELNDSWQPARFYCAVPGGAPVEEWGYKRRGLALRHSGWANPRSETRWTLIHLGSGGPVASFVGNVSTVMPVAGEIATCTDWTLFDPVLGSSRHHAGRASCGGAGSTYAPNPPNDPQAERSGRSRARFAGHAGLVLALLVAGVGCFGLPSAAISLTLPSIYSAAGPTDQNIRFCIDRRMAQIESTCGACWEVARFIEVKDKCSLPQNILRGTVVCDTPDDSKIGKDGLLHITVDKATRDSGLPLCASIYFLPNSTDRDGSVSRKLTGIIRKYQIFGGWMCSGSRLSTYINRARILLAYGTIRYCQSINIDVLRRGVSNVFDLNDWNKQHKFPFDINGDVREVRYFQPWSISGDQSLLRRRGLLHAGLQSEVSEDRADDSGSGGESGQSYREPPELAFLSAVLFLLGMPAFWLDWKAKPAWLATLGWLAYTAGFAGIIWWVIPKLV